MDRPERQIRKARELQNKVAEAISHVTGTGVQFILQELATGIAFAKLAADSRSRGDTAVADDEEERAREALQTVIKFLPEATPTQEQKTTIDASLAELDSRLAALRS